MELRLKQSSERLIDLETLYKAIEQSEYSAATASRDYTAYRQGSHFYVLKKIYNATKEYKSSKTSTTIETLALIEITSQIQEIINCQQRLEKRIKEIKDNHFEKLRLNSQKNTTYILKKMPERLEDMKKNVVYLKSGNDDQKIEYRLLSPSNKKVGALIKKRDLGIPEDVDISSNLLLAIKPKLLDITNKIKHTDSVKVNEDEKALADFATKISHLQSRKNYLETSAISQFIDYIEKHIKRYEEKSEEKISQKHTSNIKNSPF